MGRIIKYYVENGLTVIEDGNDSEFIRPSFNYNSVNDTVTIINLDNQAQDWSGPSSEFRDKNGNSIGTTKAEILAYLSDNTVFSKGESGSSTNPTSGIVPVNENGIFVDSVIAESNGKIGIGTTSPSTALDVVGAITLNDGNNSTKVGTDAGLNYTGDNQSAFGVSAGRDNTGAEQSAFGYFAGRSNTGDNQSAFGRTAGFSNTGNNQSAFGFNAGRDNTGSGQLAFGYSAGRGNTGDNQSAFGFNAGRDNTGNNNSNFGYQSGYFLSNGTTVNAASSNSVFLGSNTKALGASQTNQIVIGHDATGIGANSVTLGNDNIETTALKGNVGIGTTSPSRELEVTGTGNVYTRVTSDSGSDSVLELVETGGHIYSLVNEGSTDSFKIRYDGGTRLTINQSGNVGIGTASPTEKLDVGGIVIAEGYKSADGSAGVTQNVNTGGGNTLVIKNGIITAII